MIFSDLFKVTIIQRQITWKWYNIQLNLQWPTNRKSYMIYRTAPFQWFLTTPTPVSRSCHSLTLNISETVRYAKCHWNSNRDLHTPYATVSFWMTWVTLSDLAKYSMTRSIRGLSATAELLVKRTIELAPIGLRILTTTHTFLHCIHRTCPYQFVQTQECLGFFANS